MIIGVEVTRSLVHLASLFNECVDKGGDGDIRTLWIVGMSVAQPSHQLFTTPLTQIPLSSHTLAPVNLSLTRNRFIAHVINLYSRPDRYVCECMHGWMGVCE